MPETIQQYDEDGTKLVIMLRTPLWGEVPAGFEWDAELHERMIAAGWRQSEGVPAMYYFENAAGDCRLVKIVDDLAFSDSSPDAEIAKATIKMLREAYDGEVTCDFAPRSFAGYKINMQDDKMEISQREKVIDATRKYLPELLDGGEVPRLLTGTKLEAALDALELPPQEERKDKLTPDQKRCQQIIGDLKYFERGSRASLALRVHRLSCIMNYPPVPDALTCAESVLAEAYRTREAVLCYTRQEVQRDIADGKTTVDMSVGAPQELECAADASPHPKHTVYGIVLTMCGAAVAAFVKKIGSAVANTFEAEAVASVKASELIAYARIVQHALGTPPRKPTLLLTDNLSNQRVAQSAKAAQNSRHFLVRMTCLHQRVADGELVTAWVADPQNPSDFMTKWIPQAKFNASVRYAMGHKEND